MSRALGKHSKTSRKTLAPGAPLARAFREFSERPWRQAWVAMRCLRIDAPDGAVQGGTFRLPSLHLPPSSPGSLSRECLAGGIQAEQARHAGGIAGEQAPRIVHWCRSRQPGGAAKPRKVRGRCAEGARKTAPPARGRYAEGATRRITRTEKGPAGPGEGVEVMTVCSARVGGDALPRGGGRP